MSHSDLAITEQQNEDFFKKMRESADYKLGYCLSAINTAIWHFDFGRIEEAASVLMSCEEKLRTTKGEKP